jgi:hypothetical protein
MPAEFDLELRGNGTRFLLYPQSPVIPRFAVPEVVWLSPTPRDIGPGPEDDRMYVVDPRDKPFLYGWPEMPPWRGPIFRPAFPGPLGHFDTLPRGTRGFLCAHLYGCVRRVLDIWEGYFQHPIPWHFARIYRRLEMIPLVEWDNAQSGYGFIEMGFDTDDQGQPWPFALNFDVIAHEIGHSMLFSQLGVPVAALRTREFLAFHESAADVVALIGALHFDAVVDDLLESTRGNLYAPNVVNRIGELALTQQIRSASHATTMAEVADVRLGADGEWIDPTGRDRHAHQVGEPLTGAIFDILVDLFETALVAEGLISPAIDSLVRSLEEETHHYDDVQPLFDAAYVGREAQFRELLIYARDYLGLLLADAWRMIRAEGLDFDDVAAALLLADRGRSGGAYAELIRVNFAWRGIDPDASRQIRTDQMARS